MADYKTYLASSILTEDKIVTYRLLSRAIKVHVNTAKEMLYEFHRQQNGKKPGTIHATYLLSGTKRKEEPIPAIAEVKKDGEDDYMQSSPYMASSMPNMDDDTGESSVLSITLVKEEDLEEARSHYEHISSIHIYSIGPTPIKDLQMLSDVTREVQILIKSEDASESTSTFGTISNKNTKRRTGRRPPPPPAASIAPALVKTVPAKVKTEIKEQSKVATKSETKSSQASTANDFFGKGKVKDKPAAATTKTTGSAPSSKESTPAPAAGPPALKRENSSIFKSFAKAKPKLKRETTDSSAALSAAEDSPMQGMSDDGEDDEEDTYVAPPPKSKAKDGEVGEDRVSRKAREAKLKAMMDTDDEEEEAKPAAKVHEEVEKPDIDMVDTDDIADVEEPETKAPLPAPAASGGRRRGRRRVIKKKTVKDEDGYLVTKEEAVWESFSEDEPVAAPKPKPQRPSTAVKPKKGAAKAGQGNITSFFGKK